MTLPGVLLVKVCEASSEVCAEFTYDLGELAYMISGEFARDLGDCAYMISSDCMYRLDPGVRRVRLWQQRRRPLPLRRGLLNVRAVSNHLLCSYTRGRRGKITKASLLLYWMARVASVEGVNPPWRSRLVALA